MGLVGRWLGWAAAAAGGGRTGIAGAARPAACERLLVQGQTIVTQNGLTMWTRRLQYAAAAEPGCRTPNFQCLETGAC